MLIEPLSSVKQSEQIALQLAKLMRRVAQHAPTEHDSAVVLLQVCEIANWSHMATANPHAAFNLDGKLQGRPCEVKAPAAFGVKAVLAFGRGQAELAGNGRDLGEGH